MNPVDRIALCLLGLFILCCVFEWSFRKWRKWEYSPHTGPGRNTPVAGYHNGRPYRLDNTGQPIFSYQPIGESVEHMPPQGGSVIVSGDCSVANSGVMRGNTITGRQDDLDSIYHLAGRLTMQTAAEAMWAMNAAKPRVDDLLNGPSGNVQTDLHEDRPAWECEVRYD